MNFKSILPHLAILAIFFLVLIVLFKPAIIDGKDLSRHDIVQWQSSSKAIADFREETDKEPLWTNSMFSGMPATLVSTKYDGDVLDPVLSILNFARPYSLIFIACLGFYLMMISFRVRPLVAALGAVFFACTSYSIIGIAAGHSSRIAAVAFMPMVIAGVNYIFNKNYSWGFFLTALGLALELKVNHLQITYYLALILLVFGVHHLIKSVKSGDKSIFTKQIPVLLLAVVLAVGSGFGRLWNIVDYSKYSTRGKSELVSEDQVKSGLDNSYVFEFSNGIFEPLVLFIPNFYGGSSAENVGSKSNLADALRNNGVPRVQIDQYTSSAPTYWGDQRLSAPYYVGAIAVLLFVLALFVLEGSKKWWLVIVTILGIALSWGDNFSLLNNFLFEYFPGYNKFRSVTFTLIMSILGIAALGALGLEKLLEMDKKIATKHLIRSVLIAGGFALLAALLANIGSYSSPIDTNQLAQMPEWYIDALRADRAMLLRKDAIRSLFFVLVAGALIWAVLKEKLSSIVGLGLLLALGILDVTLLDKRYLGSEKFQEDATRLAVSKTPADELILADETDCRVFNIAGSFNEAATSYFHQSIGGYHGAKLGRYQDLIEHQLSPEMNLIIKDLQAGTPNVSSYPVLNMLNMKYIKFGNSKEQVIINPNFNGSAWLVEEIVPVNSPNEEIEMLGQIDTKKQAVIDVNKFLIKESPLSSTGDVQLTSKTLNELTYHVNVESDALVVFSEIYYPKGWKASIDGHETEIIRANYVLRALEIPKGDHKIQFVYEPKIYATGNSIMMISGILLYLSCIGFIAVPLIRKKKS